MTFDVRLFEFSHYDSSEPERESRAQSREEGWAVMFRTIKLPLVTVRIRSGKELKRSRVEAKNAREEGVKHAESRTFSSYECEMYR